jgi:hypothetical protein
MSAQTAGYCGWRRRIVCLRRVRFCSATIHHALIAEFVVGVGVWLREGRRMPSTPLQVMTQAAILLEILSDRVAITFLTRLHRGHAGTHHVGVAGDVEQICCNT